jgi:hypothetical protein
MAGKKPARNGLLLQTLKTKLVSIDAGGSQTALPQQTATFSAPAELAPLNALAPVRTIHLRHKAAPLPASSRRTQIGTLVSTPANSPSARPHETQNY